MKPAAMDEICHDVDAVAAFLRARGNPVDLGENQTAIGARRRGELVAGALFERWNGHNIWVHVAYRDPHATSRTFFRECLVYAFGLCRVQRVSAMVAASNAASLRAARKFGFRDEAVLKGAAEDGGDMLVLALRRQECRYV